MLNRTEITHIAMLLLAMCPILSMYGTFLNYAILSLLFFVGIVIAIYGLKKCYLIPEGYTIYWFYLTIDYIMITQKMGAIVPGGVNFCAFSIIVLFVAKRFDLNRFSLYMKIIVLITVALFAAQEIMWYTVGYRFVPLLPIGELTTTMSYQSMVYRNMFATRSASVFFEPSHFAVFLLIGLSLETYTYKGKGFLSKYAYIIIVAILFLRSGTGIVGMGMILLFKSRSYIKQFSQSKRMIVSLVLMIVIAGTVNLYLSTKAGREIYRRSQNELTLEEEGHSFSRFVQGTVVYSELPVLSMFFGTSDEELLPIAKRYAYSNEKDNILYMNGWAHILCHTGVIGLVLFLMVLYNLYRNNNELSKNLIWLFVILSFFEQTYCQPLMMIIFVIVTYFKKMNQFRLLYE